ncbi:MAG: biopolymer transporter ExbD [Treponema sp.]|jgi:biopolymer transport protein ExbD|nr:biopolymer transporter ExbD [Treponema sp.]
MKSFCGEKPRQTEIPITSLIDVIFMLVIFFMIGSTFEKPALAISLPTASSGEYREQALITVAVDAAGVMYLEGEKIAAERLSRALMGYTAENPELQVALDCDGGLLFQQVADVMDMLKTAGVQHVAIRHDVRR